MRRFLMAAAMLGLLVQAAGPAEAGNLTGANLGWQYYAFGGAYDGENSSGSFVVQEDSSVGGTFFQGSSVYFNILSDANSITFDYSVADPPTGTWSNSDLSLAPTIHNGIAINVLSGPTITSVSIDPSTNMVGFDASRFSFTGDQIQVDWQSLSWGPDTIVKLNVNAVSVPEPSTLALAGLGGLGLVGVARRHRRA